MENQPIIKGHVKIRLGDEVLWEGDNTLGVNASIMFASAMGFHPNLDLTLNQIIVFYTVGLDNFQYQAAIETYASDGVNVATFSTTLDPLEFAGDITSLRIKPGTSDEFFATITIDPVFTKALNQAVTIDWSFTIT